MGGAPPEPLGALRSAPPSPLPSSAVAVTVGAKVAVCPTASVVTAGAGVVPWSLPDPALWYDPGVIAKGITTGGKLGTAAAATGCPVPTPTVPVILSTGVEFGTPADGLAEAAVVGREALSTPSWYARRTCCSRSTSASSIQSDIRLLSASSSSNLLFSSSSWASRRALTRRAWSASCCNSDSERNNCSFSFASA